MREWKEGGGVFRYVRYRIGTFTGKPAYMAAFYGFAEGTKTRLPAVLHMHGGGQRAFLEERTEGQTFLVMLGNALKMSIAPKDLIGGKEATVP